MRCGRSCFVTCRTLPHVDAHRLQALRSRGIPFLTEDDLRARGEARTPDVLLPVPIFISGRQVHWIDSKATFGDPTSHLEYHATQFSAYLNRFDAGLVIYWMGYDVSVDSDPRVLLMDHIPIAGVELMSHFTSQVRNAIPQASHG